MYRIFKILFGWNYIHWYSGQDQGYSRIFVTKCGSVCFYRFRNNLVTLKNPEAVIWLTCEPSLYFANKE